MYARLWEKTHILPCSRSAAQLIGEVSRSDGGVGAAAVAGHEVIWLWGYEGVYGYGVMRGYMVMGS